MKKSLLFTVILFIACANTFAQVLPVLYRTENLLTQSVALSDTAQQGKAYRFGMNANVSTGPRYVKYDKSLTTSSTFPSGATISANVMVPTWSGDVQVSASLLKDTTVVMNSALYVVSKGGYHRQRFQFPELSGVFNKVRVNLSYLQGDTGNRAFFVDGVWLVPQTGGEILIDNCDGTTTAVEDVLSVPTEFALQQNYPNPFNPSTTIRFNIPTQSHVSLKIYDIMGREVTTLVNEELASGTHEFQFNASHLASGMYIARLQAGNFSAVNKMTLLK